MGGGGGLEHEKIIVLKVLKVELLGVLVDNLMRERENSGLSSLQAKYPDYVQMPCQGCTNI